MTVLTDFIDFLTQRKKKDINVLIEHPIFREIDAWLDVKLRALDIQCPSKRRMARKFLTIYFEEMKSYYIGMCHNYSQYVEHPHTIYEDLHKVIRSTTERAIAVYIPRLFIGEMTTRFLKHIDILSQSITASGALNSYSTEFERMSNILDMSLLFLQLEVDAIEVTINNMNGKLEKLLEGTVYDTGE